MIDQTGDPLPTLPARPPEAHKGLLGRVLVVGGSLGMAGAPALAGLAALRSGVGLLGVATPRCVQPTVSAFSPLLMTHPLADDGERATADAGDTLAGLVAAADAVAIGPGLGRSPAINRLIADAMLSAKPTVVDADALNALATLREARGTIPIGPGPRVLTPHAGEFARLAGEPLADPNDDQQRRDRAGELARSVGGREAVVLLKGRRTVVTDGRRFAVNTTGNAGMATGGAGDVLTGLLAALLAQGVGPFEAARLAAHAHGLAGDLAADKLGETALVATDLIDALPDAWRSLLST